MLNSFHFCYQLERIPKSIAELLETGFCNSYPKPNKVQGTISQKLIFHHLYMYTNMANNKAAVTTVVMMCMLVVVALADEGGKSKRFVNCRSECYFHCMKLGVFTWSECKRDVRRSCS
ncbi:hypothetical protein F0562_014571 [Nyssa sinensis]|uniref:Uncharacterized protein n=1 Tax=Nyssa sinensis TaxID=561372 RepID=A0A5J4ZNT8_9ASTE|nr:hypothetical protein F0562_014571 [Nyssa sinensis]